MKKLKYIVCLGLVIVMTISSVACKKETQTENTHVNIDAYTVEYTDKTLFANGASEYRIKKLMPYVNRYSQDKLKQILSSAYETDRNIKTGLLDQQLALEMFAAGIWR